MLRRVRVVSLLALVKSRGLLEVNASALQRSLNSSYSSTTRTMESEAEWKAKLTPEQYHVMRQKGTERPYSSPLDKHFADGEYKCAGCGETLFFSDAKFNSGCGWPAFFQPASASAVVEHVDRTMGMVRTEVTCKKCNAHLGHVFTNEGHADSKTGLRYCINGVSLKFNKKQ